MPSSVIRRFSYDAGTQQLRVEFVTGRHYVYLGVPETVAADFRNAFAKGIFFNARIRDAYRCREITDEADATKC